MTLYLPPFYGETTPAPDQRGGVGVDDRLMRQPRTTISGQQPVGNVVIDRSHPIGELVTAGWLPTANIIDLNSNGGGTAVVANTKFGRAVSNGVYTAPYNPKADVDTACLFLGTHIKSAGSSGARVGWGYYASSSDRQMLAVYKYWERVMYDAHQDDVSCNQTYWNVESLCPFDYRGFYFGYPTDWSKAWILYDTLSGYTSGWCGFNKSFSQDPRMTLQVTTNDSQFGVYWAFVLRATPPQAAMWRALYVNPYEFLLPA